MSKHIVILAGDGIGPEIMAEATKVLAKVANRLSKKYVHQFRLNMVERTTGWLCY